MYDIFHHGKRDKLKILLAIAFILVFLTIFLLFSGNKRQSFPALPTQLTDKTTPRSELSFKTKQAVFVTTNKNQSVDIYISNLNKKAPDKITSLPFLVKNISVVDKSAILYLGNLDPFDRGDGVYRYANGVSTKIIVPEEGFVFDRFSISPDKSRLAIWEVEDVPILADSKSRIVVASLKSPTERNTLSEQVAGDATLYPISWFDNDTIIADTVSTIGGGIYRGLYALNLNGSKKLLVAGENYSSLPVVSDDHNHFLYTSYNRATKIKLPPLNIPTELSREELRNPNMILEYDKSTGTSTTLVQNQVGILYEPPTYSPDGQKIAYHTLVIDTTTKQSRPYSIQIFDRSQNLTYNVDEGGGAAVVTWLNDNQLLVAKRTGLLTPLGGFLSPYSPVLDGVYTFTIGTKLYEKVLSDKPIQIIGIL